ncbi:MAG: DUF4266 domain-containing protein [Polyangiales bacterium]
MSWRGALSIVLASAALSACATVRPWERERLSRRVMAVDAPAQSAAFDAHVRAVRSGGQTAGGAGGGGCGCN